MGGPAFNDPAKLADALELARSFKKSDGGGNRRGQNRAPQPQPIHNRNRQPPPSSAPIPNRPPLPSQRQYGAKAITSQPARRASNTTTGNYAVKSPTTAATPSSRAVPQLPSAPQPISKATPSHGPATNSTQAPKANPEASETVAPAAKNVVKPATSSTQMPTARLEPPSTGPPAASHFTPIPPQPQQTTSATVQPNASASNHSRTNSNPKPNIIDMFLAIMAEKLTLQSTDEPARGPVTASHTMNIAQPQAKSVPEKHQPTAKVETSSNDTVRNEMAPMVSDQSATKMCVSAFPLPPKLPGMAFSSQAVARDSTKGPTLADKSLTTEKLDSQVQTQPPAAMPSTTVLKKRPTKGLSSSRWAS